MATKFRNSRTGRALLAAGAVAAFVAVNLAVSNVPNARIDLTQDRLFTLSKGTKNILHGLKNDVHLTLYYSEDLGKKAPNYGNFAQRVKDMLREMTSLSGGHIKLDIVDPEPFSPEEDEAVQAGLQGVPLEAGSDNVYFGLAGTLTRSNGDTVKSDIPFFQPDRENLLEYDLAKLISGLENPKKPVVAVISSKAMFGGYAGYTQGYEDGPWAVIDQAKEFFDLREVTDPKQLFEMKPDILLAVHPAHFADPMLYAIDQYIMAGGKALLFVDPWNETAANMGPNPAGGFTPNISSLNKIFDKWGVDIPADKIVADKELAPMINASRDPGKVVPAPYVVWMKPGPNQLNPFDPVTVSIKDLLIPSAGEIDVKKDASVKVEPLITTSSTASTLPLKDVKEQDPMRLFSLFKPGDHKLTVAARITGTAKSAFPDGRPVSEKEKKAAGKTGDAKSSEGKEAKKDDFTYPPALKQSAAPMNVILVSDADMLEDRFWVSTKQFFGKKVRVPRTDNGAFLLSALDNLSGSSDLISLRSRGVQTRPFTRIEALQRKAESEYRAQEQALQKKVDETQQKIEELKKAKGASPAAAAATTESDGTQAKVDTSGQKTLQDFTEELIKSRKQLRDVNYNLRKGIETLEAKIKFFVIGLVPLCLIAFAIGLAAIRSARRIASRG